MYLCRDIQIGRHRIVMWLPSCVQIDRTNWMGSVYECDFELIFCFIPIALLVEFQSLLEFNLFASFIYLLIHELKCHRHGVSVCTWCGKHFTKHVEKLAIIFWIHFFVIPLNEPAIPLRQINRGDALQHTISTVCKLDARAHTTSKLYNLEISARAKKKKTMNIMQTLHDEKHCFVRIN